MNDYITKEKAIEIIKELCYEFIDIATDKRAVPDLCADALGKVLND